ncbi:MAG: TIGR03557 family F420-dependent LLM class oxidoreductase [Chloroflexi bacterium]|nr:TIGR03557 family F420-dependent LLM class oxidoreductase [Chloroflexota bacterium]
MQRKIGYFLAHEQFSPTSLVESAVAAERAGFDSVWASDHFHPWQENQGHAGNAWLTLAAIGQRTSKVMLGTAVTCPIYRNRPALVAQAFATLGVLYPNRVFLGVGTGEAVNEMPAGGGWGPYRERIARLREAVTLIRRLWDEDRVSHQGEAYSVVNAKIYDKPKTRVPIYIAASGPRSASLAGEIGDGWMTGSGTLLERADVVEAFRRGASARGAAARGDKPEVLVEQYVFVGDEDEAYEAAPLWQFGPVEHLVRDMDDPREIQATAEAASNLGDVVRSWLVSRDHNDHVNQLRRLFEAGATHVAIHSAQADQGRLIEFYGREVLPAVRAQ